MWLDKLIELVGEEKVIVSDNLRERLSKDYYWYSPVLFEELKDKVADCVVKPTSIEEIQGLVTFAVENKVPVTIRGAGTGNYGQAIPLKGGIVLDLTKMDKLLDLKEDTVKVQAGMRLGTLEKNYENKEKN